MIQGLSRSNTFQGIELEKALEEVDGLRRRFREHLLEGDLRVAWVLLLGSLAAIRFLCGLERNISKSKRKGDSPTR